LVVVDCPNTTLLPSPTEFEATLAILFPPVGLATASIAMVVGRRASKRHTVGVGTNA
jgi:hypothetical protein